MRLYPLDEAGLWKGDRLAVLADARTLGVGTPLVRFAVATAGEHGGTRMIALIQDAQRRLLPPSRLEQAGRQDLLPRRHPPAR